MSFDSQWFQIPTLPSAYNSCKIGVVYSEADAGPVVMLIGRRMQETGGRQHTLFLPICPETVKALRAAADIVAGQVAMGIGAEEADPS